MFTSFFTLEAVLKLLALSKEYFDSGWNIFDLVIVIASLVDLSVESVNGISVLRGMRLVSHVLFGCVTTCNQCYKLETNTPYKIKLVLKYSHGKLIRTMLK